MGDVLVSAGVITAEQLQDLLSRQRDHKGPRRRIGELVVDMGFADETTVALALAEQLGLGTIDLSAQSVNPDTARLIPKAMAERNMVVILDVTPQQVVLATPDPTNVVALDDVKARTGASTLQVLVATPTQVREQLAQIWSLGSDLDVLAMTDGPGTSAMNEDSLDASHADEESAPVVKFVSYVMEEAVRLKASDIHVEPQRTELRVRVRCDGILRDLANAPASYAPSVISRLKIMASLDIAERRVPQDGRTRVKVLGRAVECRVSTMPSIFGEKVVLRLMAQSTSVPTLDQLGLEPEQLHHLREALVAPQGLILITGPTGSGKTVTLYSAISEITTPEQNVITLEDPVEMQLPGVTQVPVQEKTGMTFEKGLRAVLRQDPDIVLVGEVRDRETAELALKASLTGHQVLTTLHTNSAVGALTRLVDMGLEPFLVASSLSASVAQRLVRKVCAHCTQPYQPEETLLGLLGLNRTDLEGAQPMKGAGCRECGGSGYQGRTAVYEVLVVDQAMRQVLVKDPSEPAVAAQAQKAGMRTLRASALEKAARGATTYEEVLRVTHNDRSDTKRCPHCMKGIEDGMRVCPWCATSLTAGQCQECARTLDDAWRVCPWCAAMRENGTSAAAGSGGYQQNQGHAVDPGGGQVPPQYAPRH